VGGIGSVHFYLEQESWAGEVITFSFATGPYASNVCLTVCLVPFATFDP